MSVIPLPEWDELSQEAREFYEERIKTHGRVTNMVKMLLYSMPAFRALEFYPVRNVLMDIIGPRATYLFCYAISMEDECIICTTYHAKLLKEMGIKAEDFEFTDVEKVLIDYGRALVRNPNNIDERIYAELKRLFTKEQIVLITAVGCRMIASNLFNNALKVDLDEYLFDVKFEKDEFLPKNSARNP
jgi:hypothetical protein